ncbi:hypothetical protein AWC38_SpisGene19774 [Stylophora pistillata]|uniref:Uncharacterized protein n=1 Tax=Stylophora pistillata TaxID=50429 RepID=A0A2B4RHM6_STYPI|nr:hypothetical protein AWC38_SpisGene19774 [Stylophora pistillata]
MKDQDGKSSCLHSRYPSHSPEDGDQAESATSANPYELILDYDGDDLDEFQRDGTGIVSGKSPEEYRGEPMTEAVPAPDVELNILHHRLKDSASLAEKRKIALEIEELIEVEYEFLF